MMIDMFNHIFPPRFYREMLARVPDGKDMQKRVRGVPMLVDLDERFRVMDRFGPDYRQVLSLASPPLEVMFGPNAAIEMAQIANDGMAELVQRHPDRFPAFAASLPMNDPDAALAETHRAIQQLGARGIQIFTNVNGHALDETQFAPLFDAMAKYDLPIWVHPARGAEFPDYLAEQKSKYEIWWTFGWPYETSVFMARMVFSGLFDRLPDLKFITHHMGGMVPFFEGRVGPGWDQLGKRTSDEDYEAVLKGLKRRPFDYFKLFYADTAVFGSAPATRCGLEFFGVDKVVFASDAPFDPERGPMYIRETIKILDALEVTEDERDRIFRRNAETLMKLNGAAEAKPAAAK
jgi:aminocarboxymuconate-semialdehyde decarboxylase